MNFNSVDSPFFSLYRSDFSSAITSNNNHPIHKRLYKAFSLYTLTKWKRLHNFFEALCEALERKKFMHEDSTITEKSYTGVLPFAQIYSPTSYNSTP